VWWSPGPWRAADMANRYATSTFSITLASGASHLVIIGAHRDSTHAAVTGNPGAFTTVPLAVPQISPRLAAYLGAYPDGPQV
jgi:hypothetical protein